MPVITNRKQCSLLQTPCGETRIFNSRKLSETWERLHKKKCEKCANSAHTQVVAEQDIVYTKNEHMMKSDAYKALEVANQWEMIH